MSGTVCVTCLPCAFVVVTVLVWSPQPTATSAASTAQTTRRRRIIVSTSARGLDPVGVDERALAGDLPRVGGADVQQLRGIGRCLLDGTCQVNVIAGLRDEALVFVASGGRTPFHDGAVLLGGADP